MALDQSALLEMLERLKGRPGPTMWCGRRGRSTT
jgi:hypothetical protein